MVLRSDNGKLYNGFFSKWVGNTFLINFMIRFDGTYFDNPELLKSEKLWVRLINRQWKWAKIGPRLIDFMFLRLEHFRADPDISPGHPARDFNYFLRKLITTLDIEKSNHLYIWIIPTFVHSETYQSFHSY